MENENSLSKSVVIDDDYRKAYIELSILNLLYGGYIGQLKCRIATDEEMTTYFEDSSVNVACEPNGDSEEINYVMIYVNDFIDTYINGQYGNMMNVVRAKLSLANVQFRLYFKHLSGACYMSYLCLSHARDLLGIIEKYLPINEFDVITCMCNLMLPTTTDADAIEKYRYLMMKLMKLHIPLKISILDLKTNMICELKKRFKTLLISSIDVELNSGNDDLDSITQLQTLMDRGRSATNRCEMACKLIDQIISEANVSGKNSNNVINS